MKNDNSSLIFFAPLILLFVIIAAKFTKLKDDMKLSKIKMQSYENCLDSLRTEHKKKLIEIEQMRAASLDSSKEHKKKLIEIEQMRAASEDIIEELMQEIKSINTWIEQQGIDKSQLNQNLELKFKGYTPSQNYSRHQNEKALLHAIQTP